MWFSYIYQFFFARPFNQTQGTLLFIFLHPHNHLIKSCDPLPFIITFVHDHSTRKNQGAHLYVYFICTRPFDQNQGSFLLFNLLSYELCTYFVRYIHSSTDIFVHYIQRRNALIFRTLCPWLYEVSAIFLNVILDYLQNWQSGNFKSSRLQMFSKIGALKNFAIFPGKHLCQSCLLIKLQAWRSGISLKRDSNTGVFL